MQIFDIKVECLQIKSDSVDYNIQLLRLKKEFYF